VAVSSDSQVIATGSEDGTIKIWDAHKYQFLCTLGTHEGYVLCLAFSKQGCKLVSGDTKGVVKTWEVRDGATPTDPSLTLQQCRSGLYAVLFSPDDQKVASAFHDGEVVIWNAQSGKKVITITGKEGAVYCIAWSPEGKVIACAGWTERIFLFSVETGVLLGICKGGGSNHVMCLVFGATCEQLYSAGSDNCIIVWKVVMKEEPRIVRKLQGHTDALFGMARSPNNKYIASASRDQTVCLWDVDTGRIVSRLRAHRDNVVSVAWSPDGEYLASSSCDKTVRIWRSDVQVLAIHVFFQLHAYLYILEVQAIHVRFLCGNDKTARMWRADVHVLAMHV
jgi:WD40 repeat protein